MDGIVAAWLRLEARRRGRSLLVLALLVAFGTATVLTAVAGARRGGGAVDRLLAVTAPATAVVLPNRAGFDWAALRALPQVEAATTFPGYISTVVAEDPGDDTPSPFVAADAEAMTTIERPVVLAGRLPDPASAHEAVVTPAYAARGFGVGRRVTVLLPTPDDAAAGIGGGRTGPPRGPKVPVTIVGVVRSAWYADEPGGRGHFIPSPGLVAAYPDEILGPGRQAPLNGLVRVAEGGLPALRAWLAGRGDVEVADRADELAHVRQVIGFETGCLLVFAVAAFLTAVVLAGQAVFRYATASAADLRPLTLVGMTRRQAATATAAAVLPPAFLGAGAGVLGAVLASAWLPYGTAALYEPSPGVDADLTVLLLGWPAAVVLVTAGAAVTALLPRARPAPRRSALTRPALPVPVTTGLRFALEPGNGVALAGAVTGVLGVVAAAVFAAGVADAAARPERFGQHYALMVVFGFDGRASTPARPAVESIAALPGVAGVLDLRIASGRSGQVSVVAHTYDPVGAPVPLVLTEGAEPGSGHDVVLALTTARELGAGVGDRIPLTGEAGTREMRVSGLGFAVESTTTGYDTGAWITPAAYDAIFTGFKEHGGLVLLDPGGDPSAVAARITAGSGGRLLVFPPFTPPQRAEIRNVAVLPVALGGFLTVLALGATAHALSAAVRRRARELAVLRALGLTPGQTRGVVVVQGVVTAVIGLVTGVPLGLALGRVLWRMAAGIMPLQYVPPAAPLVWLGPVALLAVVALALAPGRRAARIPLGAALRAE
ncbi:FtsX-like permease family protein [Herbidospora cretacea]|uniref:ABC transporter permease n=1 Tax=Herbidospora cretacea TaxID=28444 RepID=UPI0004C46B8B|nr:FtsX-like permease family protein [Herbidospora cretacea]